MEKRKMVGTVVTHSTTASKGGQLMAKVEFPLTADNAKYLTQIQSQEVDIIIDPSRGQMQMEYPDESQGEIFQEDDEEMDMDEGFPPESMGGGDGAE